MSNTKTVDIEAEVRTIDREYAFMCAKYNLRVAVSELLITLARLVNPDAR